MQNNLWIGIPNYFTNDSIVDSSALEITLAEVKNTLGIYGDTTEDTYLNQLILSSEEIAANYIGDPISPITRTDYYKQFNERMQLSARFVTDNSTYMVRYYDTSRVRQTYASSNYIIDTTSKNNIIRKIVTTEFPDISTWHENPVSITYMAGIKTNQQAPVIKRAVIGIVVELYNHRSITSTLTLNNMPLSALRLLNYIKRVVL